MCNSSSGSYARPSCSIRHTPLFYKSTVQRYHWDQRWKKRAFVILSIWMVLTSSFVSSRFASFIFLRHPLISCSLFSHPISAIFNVFSFFLSPIYLLPLPPPLSLSISPFGLNSWCTIFVSVHCSLPGLPFSLSLSLLSPCSPPTWSINTCYRPAGSRPKG